MKTLSTESVANQMVLAIGTKAIRFLPMNEVEYAQYTRQSEPASNREGYLVEYEASSGDANFKEHKGYISWSPKKAFESAYNINGQLDFGQAILMARRGFRVARKGWNGKNMFVYIVTANKYPAAMNAIIGVFSDDMVPYREYWAIKAADNTVAPWSPSGSDSLANDWEVVF